MNITAGVAGAHREVVIDASAPTPPTAMWMRIDTVRVGYDASGRAPFTSTPTGRITTIGGAEQRWVTETAYAPDGRLPTVVEQRALTSPSAERLSTINSNAVSYDSNGNRLSGPGMPTQTFRADNAIATGPGPNGSGSEAYQYTPWGGLTRDACKTYNYDGFDRAHRTDIRKTLDLLPRCDALGDLLTANDEKRYDPLGRNVWARHDRLFVLGEPTLTEYQNLYPVGFGQDIAYEHTVGDADRSGRYVNTPDGTPLAVTDLNGDYQFLHRDGQGNTVTAINPGGSVACGPELDPWGEGADECDNLLTPATPNRKWYNSSRLDTTTETYQWGTRTYNPETATWQQPDTAALSGAPDNVSIGSDPLVANRYAYVNGDPINYDDPTGHRPERCRDIPEQCREWGVPEASWISREADERAGIVESAASTGVTQTSTEISDEGLELLLAIEAPGGPRLEYETDAFGDCVVGYEHTLPGQSCEAAGLSGREITEGEALRLLREDLAATTDLLGRDIGGFQGLDQNQIDALILLYFNVGSASESRTIELVVERNFGDEFIQEYVEFDIANGNRSPGLVKRRNDELELFFEGDYGRNLINLPPGLSAEEVGLEATYSREKYPKT